MHYESSIWVLKLNINSAMPEALRGSSPQIHLDVVGRSELQAERFSHYLSENLITKTNDDCGDRVAMILHYCSTLPKVVN